MTDTIWVYTSEENVERWKREAEERGMSASSYAEAMIEAGRKNVSLDFSFDQTTVELRKQRNELKEQNKNLQSRIDRLQEQALKEEREVITDYIAENPGVTYRDVVQHLIETTPTRVHEYLEYLLGDEITAEGEQFYTTSYRSVEEAQ